MANIKKAQKGTSVDSVSYYKKKSLDFDKEARRMQDSSEKYSNKTTNYIDKMTPAERKAKGVSKTVKGNTTTYKYKTGGKIKKAQAGLKASAKRVGPVDPQGAWTKVQEQTLAGKKTPVSLKRDKELGATSMAKDGKWIQKAINPKHKGYCTPMTKSTCTPKRKALAKTLKKMAKAKKGK